VTTSDPARDHGRLTAFAARRHQCGLARGRSRSSRGPNSARSGAALPLDGRAGGASRDATPVTAAPRGSTRPTLPSKAVPLPPPVIGSAHYSPPSPGS
jgi:hypothetical protein